MKKTKILIALGAVTMAIVGIFGTKPEKKFNSATQIYAGGAYGQILITAGTSSHLTTVAANGSKAMFKTVNGSAVTLFTATPGFGVKTLYFR